MKKRPSKTRIPAHALDGILDQVREVRARATTPKTPEEIRRARRVDIWKVAGFDQGPVSCPCCPSILQYRPKSGKAFCPLCYRSIHALDWFLLGGVPLGEAVERLNQGTGGRP